MAVFVLVRREFWSVKFIKTMVSINKEHKYITVADPGFPVGGAWTSYGGPWTPEVGYVSKILHVKMKESGPVGGGARAGRAPP